MEWFSSSDDWASRWIFERFLGLTYLVAFIVVINQFRPLLGERGLLPVPRFTAATPWRQAPSLFHIAYSDRLAAVVGWIGALLAACQVLALPQRGPLGVSLLVWLVLWLLYLSIVNVGQTFYAFGWESLLLEAGFLAMFLGNAETAPPFAVMWLLRWLLFRLEFGAGLIKIRGDRCWRDLSCLDYHHETQPMPNRLSWYFHHLPKPLHRVEVAANHFAQLVVPWFLFAPEPLSTAAATIIVITQMWLVLSGNFSWLNFLTIGLGLAAIDGSVLAHVLPIDAAATSSSPAWHDVLVIGLTVVVIVLSYWPASNMISRHQAMNASFNELRLVNTYGAFGRITRERHEVIVEGTDDATPSETTTWREYQFKGKPGDVRRRPRQVAPYHLRLDWMMWFLALSPAYADTWFTAFVVKLLQGDPATLRLLAHNPFPEEPPAFVRARLYRYRYTTRMERRQTGACWSRTLVGDYLSPRGLSASGRT